MCKPAINLNVVKFRRDAKLSEVSSETGIPESILEGIYSGTLAATPKEKILISDFYNCAISDVFPK